MGANVRVLPADEWPGTVAAEFIDRLRAMPHLRACLPTGRTPAALYRELVATARRGDVSFTEAGVLLLDEYVGLAPDDPARCDRALRAALLEQLPAGPRAFHAIPVDTLPAGEAAAAHDEVAGRGIDLALVGLGGNGHVGFNEPGSTADSPTRVVALTAESVAAATALYGALSSPSAGITLGLDRLLGAGEVWLLVTGAHKSRVLRAALEGPETPACPASYLRRHPRLIVFTDEPAAAEIDASV